LSPASGLRPANLALDRHGIWTHAGRRELSYPESGHAAYFRLEDSSFWFAHRNRCILAALRRFPPSGPVLDVGGGNGFVAKGMIDAGFPAALLEPGPVGAFNGKTGRGIPDVFCATLEDAGFPEASLPAIGCFDVIEHVEDDSALVARFHGLLRPGGMLYGTVPAYPGLWSASDAGAGHFRRYTPTALRKLLSSGFETLYCTAFFSALTVPVFLTRSLPYRLGFRGSLLSAETEHGAGGGSSRIARLLEAVLSGEAGRIAAGKSRRAGTSLIFVARKAGAMSPQVGDPSL
jgi:SAM-dependent methyltransferase